jgi:uncharacterized protein YndB with AHSA1/START domain
MAELVREIMIDATPETIWPYLTQADKHIEWDGTEADLDARPGGVYRVLVAGQYQAAGEFVEVVPMQRVVYTFGWGARGEPDHARVQSRGDHARGRGQQDPSSSGAQRATGRRGERPHARVGPLPRTPLHQGDGR